MMYLWLVWLFAACGGDKTYIVEGVVVQIDGDTVTLDHEEIVGLMPAMVMDIPVSDVAMLEGVEPGHRIVGRYQLHEDGGRLEKLRIVGRGPVPELAKQAVPIRPGRTFPRYEITTHDGETLVIGKGQTGSVGLTLIYTRCPIPEYCPAMMARLQALQAELATDEPIRLVGITLDPEHDTVDVLKQYAEGVAAGPKLRLGRAPEGKLEDVAMNAGMAVLREKGEIVHSLRFMVLDSEGRLVERYDDARFPAERVLQQLRTGGPPAPPNQSGTTTP